MEKRFQVFVSSTFRDLIEERQQVIQALLELDCIPAGMELFPAADDEKWELIKRVIDDCDYYLVIIGGRYGSVDAEGVSYTEREYDYAASRSIPVLAFLHERPDEIPAGKTELGPEARERLDAFRQKTQERVCRYWSTPEQLGGVVSRSLIQTIKARPGEGWVRARFATSPEETNALREQLDQLSRELEASRLAPPPEAEGLAKGDATFPVRFSCRNEAYNKCTGTLDLTWDEIFAVVGPCMFDEAPESKLREQLAKKVESIVEDISQNSTRIDEEDFQTIKVQLFALGLILKSERRRGVRDTQTYWTLTAYGERHATVLKAIRSD